MSMPLMSLGRVTVIVAEEKVICRDIPRPRSSHPYADILRHLAMDKALKPS